MTKELQFFQECLFSFKVDHKNNEIYLKGINHSQKAKELDLADALTDYIVQIKFPQFSYAGKEFSSEYLLASFDKEVNKFQEYAHGLQMEANEIRCQPGFAQDEQLINQVSELEKKARKYHFDSITIENIYSFYKGILLDIVSSFIDKSEHTEKESDSSGLILQIAYSRNGGELKKRKKQQKYNGSSLEDLSENYAFSQLSDDSSSRQKEKVSESSNSNVDAYLQKLQMEKAELLSEKGALLQKLEEMRIKLQQAEEKARQAEETLSRSVAMPMLTGMMPPPPPLPSGRGMAPPPPPPMPGSKTPGSWRAKSGEHASAPEEQPKSAEKKKKVEGVGFSMTPEELSRQREEMKKRAAEREKARKEAEANGEALRTEGQIMEEKAARVLKSSAPIQKAAISNEEGPEWLKRKLKPSSDSGRQRSQTTIQSISGNPGSIFGVNQGSLSSSGSSSESTSPVETPKSGSPSGSPC